MQSSRLLLCMLPFLIRPLCSVEVVHSGINFSIFSFHNLLGVAGIPCSLLRSLVEHSLKVGQYCPTHPPDDRGRHLLKMPQQGSIFSYISPGSSLRKSMTGKLVYNFPLMSMYFTSSLLRVPNSNDNYTFTFTRITVHKRCSF